MLNVDILLFIWEIFLLVVLLAAAWHLRLSRKKLLSEKTHYEAQLAELEAQKNSLADVSLNLLELKDALELEQRKSAELLRNILPDRVIDDLRQKGFSAPERFDNVTVFFSDIVGFTEIAPKIDPALLIKELSDIFGEFDRIFASYNCQRIKTVGDAYMAVAGMPESDEYHYRHILLAAMEARAYLIDRNRQEGKLKWLMRFGLNSGSVVGGIVGRDKYIYDIFGDTVNIASRMEHASETMKINVSEATYQLAKDDFAFVRRGDVLVKGKGALAMYFLEGLNR